MRHAACSVRQKVADGSSSRTSYGQPLAALTQGVSHG